MAAARVIVHSLRTSEWSGELDSVFFGRSLVRITGSSDAGICSNSHVLFTPLILGRTSFIPVLIRILTWQCICILYPNVI